MDPRSGALAASRGQVQSDMPRLNLQELNPAATRDLENAVARLAELLQSKDRPDEDVQKESDHITDEIIQRVTAQINSVASAQQLSPVPLGRVRPAPTVFDRADSSRDRAPVPPLSLPARGSRSPDRRLSSASISPHARADRFDRRGSIPSSAISQPSTTPRSRSRGTYARDQAEELYARSITPRSAVSPGRRVEERLLAEGEMMYAWSLSSFFLAFSSLLCF